MDKKEARLKALGDLKAKMSEMEGKPVKATVIAKDKEGLEEGLEKAKEILESSESEEKDYDSMSKEELIELLKKS